jgi:hypothetical protein
MLQYPAMKWEKMILNRIMRLFWDAIALNLWNVAAITPHRIAPALGPGTRWGYTIWTFSDRNLTR